MNFLTNISLGIKSKQDTTEAQPVRTGAPMEEKPINMEWNRSNAIALAFPFCTVCHGNGTLLGRAQTEIPCKCVLRAVFRACYNRFRECVALEKQISPVTVQFCHGADGRRNYARRREEFMADFDLVSRRALDDPEYKIFRLHFMLGAPAKACCDRLKLDRGDFFHVVYSIMEKLGRVFAELRPYPLFPADEYFAGMVLRHQPQSETSLNRVFAPFDEPFSELPLTA